MHTESLWYKTYVSPDLLPSSLYFPALVFAIEWLTALAYIIQVPVSAGSGRIGPMGDTAGRLKG